MHWHNPSPVRHPPGFIEPCLPTISRTVPSGPLWAYEIKHDGFRFLAVRQRKQVRIYSRGGHDWSERLPAITEAMQSLPVRSVVLDGEGVICGADGKSDFDRMRACFSRHGAPEAFLYAFDVLELDGQAMRTRSWAARRAALVRLLGGATVQASACASTSRMWTARGRVPAGLRHGPGGHRRQAPR
jgi:bifunctional non-homologous end joining protein LigD